MDLPSKYWKYCIEEGSLFDPEGRKIAIGYSGHDAGRNNPELQASVEFGPIPEGWWIIDASEQGQSFMGELAFAISPTFGTSTYGRNQFYIHGDDSEDVMYHPQVKSHSCLFLHIRARSRIARSEVKDLLVVKNENSVV